MIIQFGGMPFITKPQHLCWVFCFVNFRVLLNKLFSETIFCKNNNGKKYSINTEKRNFRLIESQNTKNIFFIVIKFIKTILGIT